MSEDKGDAASGCAMFWKSVFVFSSECPPWRVSHLRLYHEAHNAPIFDTVHAIKQRCRSSPRHCNSRVLLSPLHCPEVVRKISHWPLISQLLPGHSYSGPYHIIKALIRSFLLSQGGCIHTWQILLGLFASTEKLVPLGRLHTAMPNIASLNIRISVL